LSFWKDHAVNPSEPRVVGHHADVVHRAGIARQRHAIVIGGVRRFMAACHCDPILFGNAEALDLNRALGGRRPPLTSQAAEPRAGGTGLITEALTQLVEFTEPAVELFRLGRCREQHVPAAYTIIRIIV
jgi:hypothetical protein